MTKISIIDQFFDEKYDFDLNYDFDQNYYFWPKLRFATKIMIFDLNYDFLPKFQLLTKFWFLTKIQIFDLNCDFWQNFYDLRQSISNSSTVTLSWSKTDSCNTYVIEEKDKYGIGRVFVGHSTECILRGLEPMSEHQYRMKCQSEDERYTTPWITVYTTKEPVNCEHLIRACRSSGEYSAYALIVTPLIDTFALIDTLFWVIFFTPP